MRDSDSGLSPSLEHEKGSYNGEARHTEQVEALDRFPDPDAGKSDEEKALIVRDLDFPRRVMPRSGLTVHLGQEACSPPRFYDHPLVDLPVSCILPR